MQNILFQIVGSKSARVPGCKIFKEFINFIARSHSLKVLVHIACIKDIINVKKYDIKTNSF
jgi:hypothetical protein